MKVNFHIGRLVVEGASHAEALRVAHMLRSRLAEFPTAAAIRPASVAHVDAGVLPPTYSAEQIGSHVASQILASLKGPRHA